MRLIPEMDLMFFSSMHAPGPQDIAHMEKLIDRGIHWETFVALVGNHKLFGPVYQTMSSYLKDAVPEAIQKTIKSHYMANVRKSLLNTAEAMRISDLFTEKGIDHLFLKGLCLSQYLYGNAGFRHAGDIDLIIPDEKLYESMDIMESLGYRQVQSEKPLTRETLKKLKEISHHVKYTSISSPISVELHWRFYNIKNVFPISFEQAIQDKTHISVQGRDLPVLSDRHALIFLCVHGAKHAWERLVWLKDIQDFYFSTVFDKDRFWEDVNQRNMIRPVAEAFGLMNKINGIDIPEHVSDYMRSSKHIQRSLKRIFYLYRDGNDPRSILVSYYHKMLTIEGLRNYYLYVKTIFLTKQYKRYFNPGHKSRLLRSIKRALSWEQSR